MEVLTLGGKEYVKASKAAKDLGYASDYVGQLCRSGAVDAHLVGRTWYVNPETLGAHRIEKKRTSRMKAREHAHRSIEAAKHLAITQNTKSAHNIDIRYEHDTKELIPRTGPLAAPEVKRVHIATSENLAPAEKTEEESDVGYEILNANKKIVMSGKIPVYDVDEETVLTDVTILTPRLNRAHAARLEPTKDKGPILATQSDVSESRPEEGADTRETDAEDAEKKLSFTEKLAAYTRTDGEKKETREATAQTEVATVANVEYVLEEEESKVSIGAVFVYSLLNLLIALSMLGLFLHMKVSYEGGVYQDTYSFSIPDIKSIK